MKWKRRETRREKRERIQQEAERPEIERREQERRDEEFRQFLRHCEQVFQERPQSAEAGQLRERLLEAGQHSHAKTAGDPYENWLHAADAGFTYVAGAFPGFWETMRGFRTGRTDVDPEPFLRYLEADPYFFHSGFIAADCIRYLKRFPLTENQKARLQRVVLHAVDSRDRREFRDFCRLARAVDAPELRAALRERLTYLDPNVRRRAGWMLAACEQRNEREP